ncbi:hypothetical protein WCD74_03155 [Actinomycetospora sp. OC33-EN08]|uniref:DUF317 domain-containing protein n=1 Tax=Actinomycetospora aurantiaca TaxID=3129233 RepID=A0ABU8MJD5_9PSEU
MALGLFGRLSRHADRPQADEDAYSVFHALSSLLGHLTPTGLDAGAAWGMNDAGGPSFTEEGRDLCGWFQVSPLNEHVVGLPIPSFTDTCATTLGRFGTLDVEGYEYYLPTSVAGPAGRQIANAENWFSFAPPASRTRVVVSLDSGDASAVVDRRDDVLEQLSRAAPTEEGLDPRATDETAPEFAEAVPWRWWLGHGPPHTVTFSVTLTEWTPLGVGRAVSLISEACRAVGMVDHVGVRVARV